MQPGCVIWHFCAVVMWIQPETLWTLETARDSLDTSLRAVDTRWKLPETLEIARLWRRPDILWRMPQILWRLQGTL